MADLRYISIEPSLILYGVDGKPKVKFIDGEYIGPKIEAYDATNKEWILTPRQSLKDLLGATDIDVKGLGTITNDYCPEEVCGLGSLNGYNHTKIGATTWQLLNGLPDPTATTGNTELTSILHGYNGVFFLAPEIATVGSAGTHLPIAGNYKVKTGTISYNGTSYTVGQTIPVTDETIHVIGVGAVTLELPDMLAGARCGCNAHEWFKIKHMMVGDEATSYFLWNNGGFTPKTDLGWVR